MENMYNISVVVPVYNGERYLRECIESILSQNFDNFEIVLVDDGSKDNSGIICDEYAQNHENIHVFHKKNEGINKTREFGVNVSKGEWISFVDQDDTLQKNALSELWEKHFDTDIVIGFPDTPTHKKVLTLEECRENAITAKLFPPTPWAKLYRKSILTCEVFDFPRGIDGEEDMIMNIRLIFKIIRPPHFVFKKVYNFRRNLNSVSHKKKASLEHEVLFDRVRKESIPSNEICKYMHAIINSRLNGLTGVAYSYPKILCNKKLEYLTQLRKDIKEFNYKLNLQEWSLLNFHKSQLYKALSLLIMVKNFIRYHLNLNN